jgi:adhesin transport system membrane fusion protein
MKTEKKMRIGTIRLSMVFMVTMLVWASIYELDQTVSSLGSVTPHTRTQVIQVADGGVLEKLLVQEGQAVKAGQLLAVLEKERASAGVDEGSSRLAFLKLALMRAQAQSTDTKPDFQNLDATYRVFANEQKQLFEAKKQAFEDETASIKSALNLAKEEQEINEKLGLTGDVSRLDLIRSRRQVSELEGKLTAVSNKYIADARDEAAKILIDLDSQKFRLQEKKSVLDHAELISPVDGVVKSLRVTTVGGVLRAGDEIMQISPSDVELIVEAKVSPGDIGLLRVGLPVQLRVDAFDYTIYGGLMGTLSYISSDTLVEQMPSGQSTSYYRVQIQLQDTQSNTKLSPADLRPGMTVGTDIRTGKRSVLAYLLKPVARAFQGAGAQR